MPFEIQAIPERLVEFTRQIQLPDDVNQTLFASSETINRYCYECAIELYNVLVIGPNLKQWASVDDLLKQLAFTEKFRYALTWILRMLHTDHLLEQKTTDKRHYYRQEVALPSSQRETLRQQCIESNPHNAAFIQLLDVAMAAYPAVARGEITGEQALFGVGELQLWLDFFHNDNTLYAINNQIAALVAADAIESCSKITILEFGAGAGSASDALLAELRKRGRLDCIEAYWVTEPNAFFHRKGQRLLTSKYPETPFKAQPLDINKPWREQLTCDRFDLIYSVNTLHVAKNISFTLDQAKQLLPQGWFVAGECLRPFPQQPVYIEMIFQILDSFLDVELNASLRPQPGFLTPEQWRGWFENSGFSSYSITPDIETLRDSYDRFITGAICAYHSNQ